MRTNPKAPRVMRSQAVPATPTSSNSDTEMAAPNCTDSIATTASDHAGTRSIGEEGTVQDTALGCALEVAVSDEDLALAEAVGRRVRDARTARGWTLDRLAERSGVSRRMIVNVESGASNASIATLLRLSGALQVSLADLVAESDRGTRIEVTTARQRTPLWRGPHGGVAELVTAAGTPDILELWEWTLEPDEAYTSEAHARGTRELIHVHSGRMRITVGDDAQDLGPGDGATFIADAPHAYANRGRSRLRFTMSVLEPLPRSRP